MKPTNTLQYKNYTCQIGYYSVNDCLVGKVLGMSQIRNVKAQTVKGIKTEFHRAVDDYLLTCEETGKEPVRAFSGNFSVHITPAVHEALTLYAASKGVLLAKVIQSAIYEYLENHDIQVDDEEG